MGIFWELVGSTGPKMIYSYRVIALFKISEVNPIEEKKEEEYKTDNVSLPAAKSNYYFNLHCIEKKIQIPLTIY